MRFQSAIRTFICLMSLVLLTGCGLFAGATPTSTPTETPTPIPSLTPTPVIPLAILVVPADMDQETSSLYQKTVYDLTQQSGYRFQVRNALSPADLEAGLKVVIAFPPDPGLVSLAAAAPQAQFLAVNIPGMAAGGNLSVLADTARPDKQAFLAGYIGAMITDDYHIGMIIPKDNPEAQKALAAYANGMTFYCGLCNPFFYLNYRFPQYLEIPAGEDPNKYGAYVNILSGQLHVDTFYVYPDLATAELLAYIANSGLWQIGLSTPEQPLAGWVATIQPDVVSAIQSAWPELIAGKGGVEVVSPLTLNDVNPGLLSPGKQRLAEEVLQNLLGGYIDPGAQP